MISFLNLNVNEVFDNVSHFQLLYNMKKKKISSKLLKFFEKFFEK